MNIKNAFSLSKSKLSVLVILGALFIFLSGFCNKFGNVPPTYTECLNIYLNRISFWMSLISILVVAYLIMSIISLVKQKLKE